MESQDNIELAGSVFSSQVKQEMISHSNFNDRDSDEETSSLQKDEQSVPFSNDIKPIPKPENPMTNYDVQTDSDNPSNCSNEKPFLPFSDDTDMLIKTESISTEDSNLFHMNSGNEIMGSYIKQEFVHICEVNTSGKNNLATSASNPSLLSETVTILPENLEQKVVSACGSQLHSERVEHVVLQEENSQYYITPFQTQHDSQAECSSTQPSHYEGVTKIKQHQSDICNKTFTQKSDLKTLNNMTPFKCELCEKAFTRSSDLKRHHRVHTKEKPYQCGICNKSFSRQHHLTEHRRIHNNVKPYKCELCQNTFFKSVDLKRHHRVHTKEKPYQCGICNKSFSQQGSLTVHQRIHNNEKTFQCDICGKAFTTSTHLKTHHRVHTKEKPYQCIVCKKSFTQQSHLIVHKRIHNNANTKPFKS